MRPGLRAVWLLGCSIGLWAPGGSVRAQVPPPAPTAIAPDGADADLAADASSDAAYQSVVERAVAEFSAGRWAEARALFGQAHAIEPNARTLRGLGMSAFELRMYVQAIEELQAALTDARKPLTARLRVHAEELLARAQSFVGRVHIDVTPAAAEVLVDGKPWQRPQDGSVLLDAGTHTLGARAAGHRAQSVRVQVEGGRTDRVQLTLQPLPAPLPVAPVPAPVPAPDDNKTPQPMPPGPARGDGDSLRPHAWVTGAGAVAFGIAAAAFWAVGEGQYGNLRDACEPRCSQAAIDDSGVATSDALTNTFLGLSILSGLTSAVLFGIDAASDGEAPARVELSPAGASVRGRF